MCKKVAVILAGGKGTRLRPYTIAMPKPLVPIGQRPILEIIITQLKKIGFTDIYMAVNHQAELIEAYFGDGSKYGLNITYFLEDKPLGTMGPLQLMKDSLPDDFLVMNGDVLSDLNYQSFLQDHIDHKSMFTISSYERVQAVDYGVLKTDGDVLCGFEEKPKLFYDVSMGVYAVSRRVLEYIPYDTFFGFDMLMKEFLAKDIEVNTKKFDGYWMDIGRPDDYASAVEDVESGKFKY